MFIIKLLHIITNTFTIEQDHAILYYSRSWIYLNKLVEDTKRCASWSAHCHNAAVIIRQKENSKEGIWTWVLAILQLINLIDGLFFAAVCPSLPLI